MLRRLEHIRGEEMLRQLDLFCLEKAWGLEAGRHGNLVAFSSHLGVAYREERVKIFLQLKNNRTSDNSCKLQQSKF